VEVTVVLSVLNAKYVYALPPPWYLVTGVKAYAPELYCHAYLTSFMYYSIKITGQSRLLNFHTPFKFAHPYAQH